MSQPIKTPFITYKELYELAIGKLQERLYLQKRLQTEPFAENEVEAKKHKYAEIVLWNVLRDIQVYERLDTTHNLLKEERIDEVANLPKEST